jgi:hypothetical protein
MGRNKAFSIIAISASLHTPLHLCFSSFASPNLLLLRTRLQMSPLRSSSPPRLLRHFPLAWRKALRPDALSRKASTCSFRFVSYRKHTHHAGQWCDTHLYAAEPHPFLRFSAHPTIGWNTFNSPSGRKDDRIYPSVTLTFLARSISGASFRSTRHSLSRLSPVCAAHRAVVRPACRKVHATW